MRSAPSVVYPVGRCAFQGWVLVVLGGVSASAELMFLLQTDVRSQGLWGWLICCAVPFGWSAWMAWAFLNWRRSPVGSLHWSSGDGQRLDEAGAWSWTDRAAVESLRLAEVECVLDLQRWVLLRVVGVDRGQHWLWVERSARASRWGDLRRALVSSRA